MATPRVRFTSPGREAESAVLNVDYEVVLRQAVENERFRVLRSLRGTIEAIPTRKPTNSYTYRSDPETADVFKNAVLKALTNEEVGS